MSIIQEHTEIEAAKRDPRRFTPLYERYFADIYRFLHRRSRDNEVSADLTQQTFLKAMLALDGYEIRGTPFRAWLYRIAYNELRMHWRKRKEVLIDLSFVEVKDLADEIGSGANEEAMQKLAQAMGRLKSEKSRLIELRFMDGMSYAEMGMVLGIAEDAAKMRTHRVLLLLRGYMGPKG